MIKQIALVKRREGTTPEEFSDYWLNKHAPLAARRPGLRQYVQNVVIGGETGFDGMAELGYDDHAALEMALRSDNYKAEQADLLNFLDVTGILRVVAVERRILG